MQLALPYMGTKRDLAPVVANVIARTKPGIVLDAFSGMCAIGQSIATHRNVWNNDVQHFAAQVASALFTSRRTFRLRRSANESIQKKFHNNVQALTTRFKARLARERSSLDSNTVGGVREYLRTSRHVGVSPSLELERSSLQRTPHEFPYRLCAITFVDGFFGLRQAIEIDSARYAIDQARSRHEIDADEFRWLLIGICYAAVRIATTTGHFAQFLTVKRNNLPFYISQRRRSFWDTWIESTKNLQPIGSFSWRRQNRAFNQESLSLLGFLSTERVRPSVVYADPPYTDDQYSRYYHVWETLVRYDYPSSQGAGRYRPDRFQTPFSRKTDVAWSIAELIRRTADLGADLVLSYPSRGLLHLAGHELRDLLEKHFSTVEISAELSHEHSTMGASKGEATQAVTERIYFASNS